MGKAINAFVEKSPDNDTQVIKLSIIDFLHPLGVREKSVVKKKQRNPQVMCVTCVRKVTYLYDKKTTTGWEIVNEFLMSREEADEFSPVIVGEITRDLRTPGYVEPVKREYNDNE